MGKRPVSLLTLCKKEGGERCFSNFDGREKVNKLAARKTGGGLAWA